MTIFSRVLPAVAAIIGASAIVFAQPVPYDVQPSTRVPQNRPEHRSVKQATREGVRSGWNRAVEVADRFILDVLGDEARNATYEFLQNLQREFFAKFWHGEGGEGPASSFDGLPSSDKVDYNTTVEGPENMLNETPVMEENFDVWTQDDATGPTDE